LRAATVKIARRTTTTTRSPLSQGQATVVFAIPRKQRVRSGNKWKELAGSCCRIREETRKRAVSILPVEEIAEEIAEEIEELPEKLSDKKTRKKGKRVIKR
jgi:hypothetical protein